MNALRLTHVALAALIGLILWRATAQSWVADLTAGDAVAVTIRVALPLVGLAGSALLVALGRERPLRALVVDAASIAAMFIVVFTLALGPVSRDAIGLLFILAVIARIGPAVVDVAT